MENKPVITIEGDQVFYDMQNFLTKEINNLQAQGIPRDKIQIYIPDYFLRLFQYWCTKQYYIDYIDHSSNLRFMGVKMLDNWDKKIVVSFEGIHYHSKLKPAILEIK